MKPQRRSTVAGPGGLWPERVYPEERLNFRSNRIALLDRLCETDTEPRVQTARTRVEPVFIVGCPRSGTTLLYDTLLSSGSFALYPAESDVFYRIAPAFGSLRSLRNKRGLIDSWLSSDYFRRTGLSAKYLREQLLLRCRNAGDFLRIVMDALAESQGARRWAENTPFHILYLAEIKKQIPDAVFIHIIRDGRDTAVSMNRLGWPSRFAWDSQHPLAVSALWWEWHVTQGREEGRKLGRDYLEVHYEDLVTFPHETLKKIGIFIGENLDYDDIQRNAFGTVARPNSSFPGPEASRTVGRWRSLPESDLARLNALLSPLLEDLGYETDASSAKAPLLENWRLRSSYQTYWSLKQKLRTSPVSRFLLSRDRLERGALDRFDARWEEIRRSH